MEIGENEEENETEKEKKEENEKPETETENEKPEAEKEQPEKEEEKEKKLNVGERILGLDIRNYGRVFERNSQWLQIRQDNVVTLNVTLLKLLKRDNMWRNFN